MEKERETDSVEREGTEKREKVTQEGRHVPECCDLFCQGKTPLKCLGQLDRANGTKKKPLFKWKSQFFSHGHLFTPLYAVCSDILKMPAPDA